MFCFSSTNAHYMQKRIISLYVALKWTDKTLKKTKYGQNQSVFALQEKITPEQNGLKVDLYNLINPQHGFQKGQTDLVKLYIQQKP